MSSPGVEQQLSINDNTNSHLEDTNKIQNSDLENSKEEHALTITVTEADQPNAEEFKNQGNEFMKSKLTLSCVVLSACKKNNITS